MSYNWEQIYRTFEQYKSTKEYSEYISEMSEIADAMNTISFDSVKAAKLCSYLAGKYETEIEQLPIQNGEKKTVIKGDNLPPKTMAELISDLQFFHAHIPLFALKREIKSELTKQLLGLSEN